MTKVKICGITNLEDAQLSAKFGADALGFNFYPKSPRFILPGDARKIIDELPEHILNVGVFVNEELVKIIEIVKLANLDAIQLHGEETPEFAKELKEKTGLEIIKAFRVSPEFEPKDVLKYEVDAILLDAYSPKEHGGTGETFDWKIAKKVKKIFPKIYLAGGLKPDNISEAIMSVEPQAVDACSCIEKTRGVKDKPSLINLISNVKFSNMKNSKKDNLLYMLRLIRSLPNSYLFPKKSITHLCSFIYGYLVSSFTNKSIYEKTDKFLNDFEKFEGINRGMFAHAIYNYAEYFLEKSEGKEERAFDLFYAKLEEFLLEKDLGNEKF